MQEIMFNMGFKFHELIQIVAVDVSGLLKEMLCLI